MSTKIKVLICSFVCPTRSLYPAVVNSLQQRKILDKFEITSIDVTSSSLSKNEEVGSKVVNCDVLLADEAVCAHVASQLYSTKCQLKFIQLVTAGFNLLGNAVKAMNTPVGFNLLGNAVKAMNTPPSYPVARLCGVFGPHLAEYIMGQIISRERMFTRMSHDQDIQKWNKDSYVGYRRISNLTIGILGVGDAGREVARVCKSFGMTVWGVTKSHVTSESASPYVDQYRHLDDLSEVLAVSDYVCNILPSTPETRGILCGDVFKHCSNKKSVFVNIGRGDVTSDQCIVKAIRNGWLGGAILDVFESEPLSTDSELWKIPGVSISPHVAGLSHGDEVANIFVDQMERYLYGQPLLYVIDWKKGY